MISIVIPTYNEEKFLPLLLKSIKKQGYKDYNIIVADSSTDKTRKIAKKYGCIVVDGGNPAKARNNGAKITNHDLLFLDADDILPDKFLGQFIRACKGYDIVSCKVLPASDKFSYNLYYLVKNFLNKNNPTPHCSGQCVFIKKSLFNKISGYDEYLFLGEEHDLVQRSIKSGGTFKFLDLHLLNSPRRIEKEGFFGLTFKSLYSEGYRMVFGNVKRKFIEYDYSFYSK